MSNEEKGPMMTEQARNALFRMIDNWQGTLILVFALIIGFPTALNVWMILQQGGYVNSGASQERMQILKAVNGNQVLLSGLYYQTHAKCMQDAAREAKEEGWFLSRLEQACKDADARLNRHMTTLGVYMEKP